MRMILSNVYLFCLTFICLANQKFCGHFLCPGSRWGFIVCDDFCGLAAEEGLAAEAGV
jgi:hypothetical protein